MIAYVWAMLIGIVGGVFVGLVPSITPVLGFLILLPLISNDPVSLLILAMTLCIGSQFFGSQAAFYYRMAGETSSYPVLMEIKNFNTPEKIHQAIDITTRGSLVATAMALSLLMLLLTTGLLNQIILPIVVKAVMFVFILIIALFYPFKTFLYNLFGFASTVAIGNYSDIAVNISSSLPVYYFDPLYSLIILFAMFMLWDRTKIENFNTDDIKKSKHFLWKHWINKFLGHGILGLFCGLVPTVGATLSSYSSYAIEKFRGKSSMERVAASETANNSAIITGWVPLLAFGVPITATEIVFLQHFNQHGLQLQSLLAPQSAFIFLSLCMFAGLIYYYLALRTNQAFYKGLSKILLDIRTAILIVLFCVLSYAVMNKLAWEVVLVHLLVLIPVSWAFHRLSINLLSITVGLLMSNQIFFTLMQLYQIYF